MEQIDQDLLGVKGKIIAKMFGNGIIVCIGATHQYVET
jgi:hypothetical protein